MNKLEELPKIIKYNDVDYALKVWVTIYKNLCVGYTAIDYMPSNKKTILSFVVESENEVYIPDDLEEKGINTNIGNAKTLDDCIDYIKQQIKRFNIQTY